ncbi:MAG TPA: dienelactone hydrolase family protein [Thermoanaerobaculia bacterium]|jgi:carboxymethylenebutenolidase|nr:dienelactone hydrolase family protein [Thermoanaerobaculia bacterium]
MKRTVLAFLISGLAVPVLAQDWALKRLEQSPRHHEWIAVKNGERTIQTFVAYPQVKTKATAVVLIHENRGLTDWVRGVADQLAEAGYVALAPDLLSGAAPQGGRTSDFASSDAAREAIYKLTPDQVLADLDAVADQAAKLPASNGKVTVAGFCWGGGQSLRFATHRGDLKAAFVFYGTFDHTKEDLARIKSPVYGFYGGTDARIGETVPKTAALMKELGKTYEPVTYEGAGHGFMRGGEDPQGSEADRKARAAAWERWMTVLKSL